jgi:hypothetical protein
LLIISLLDDEDVDVVVLDVVVSGVVVEVVVVDVVVVVVVDVVVVDVVVVDVVVVEVVVDVVVETAFTFMKTKESISTVKNILNSIFFKLFFLFFK